MSDRREFLKSAGFMGIASLSKSLAAQPENDVQEVPIGHRSEIKADAIVLENAEMRLVISSSGSAQSLLHKSSAQECLATGAALPMFNVTQYRPYDNELQQAYPAQKTSFPADRLRREGDRLVVNFALVDYEASIGIRITEAYIAFRLERLSYRGDTSMRPKVATPIDEAVFVQLPVRKRKNLGEWLNVMWDGEVAVNLLATNPYTRIRAQERRGHYLFQAGSVADV